MNWSFIVLVQKLRIKRIFVIIMYIFNDYSRGSMNLLYPRRLKLSSSHENWYIYIHKFKLIYSNNIVTIYFRVSTYLKREVSCRYWGLLFGFQLVFNKKGKSLHIHVLHSSNLIIPSDSIVLVNQC